MLAEERQSRILAIINRQKSVQLSEICSSLEISESTARRDLKELADKNLIVKVHGGAMSKEDDFFNLEANMEEKHKMNQDEKLKVAKYAASLIEDGDCIYLDAGTTTELMIDYIVAKDVTIITNAMGHALRLAKKGYNVMLTGGRVKAFTEALVGTECIKSIYRYNFSKCFMGVNGISLSKGLSTPDSLEAAAKEAAVNNSEKPYLLADHSKFGVVTAVKFAEAKDVTIITDELLDEKYRQLPGLIVVGEV